jgi:hypothetical protein
MVKLTVMYTLPEGADHEEFLKWRTTEHQKKNMGIPGVIKSDFYAVREIYTHGQEGENHRTKETRPDTEAQTPEPLSDNRMQEQKSALEKRIIHEKESETGSKAQEQASEGRLRAHSLFYRYITEAYWPDMKSFRSAFFDSGYQKRLMDSLQKIANPLFLISEEVLSEGK